ncbi:MAG: 6-phospho-beta-glucosidase [Chloroflexi bacterium HGW-Chloroflexi-10]|nr:MAG: 6-phospho-beta-glucosidase [Chloroflexi bacterium HGW-Chloroflexi-10]
MKVTVIGGGSTYTPELIMGFLARVKDFPLSELWLMDIDEARLNIVGGFAKRIVAAHGSPFQVILTTNQREAVKEAAYVTTQLRVGQMQARREDEYLGLRHGLVGQETTGIGGMAKALRTIPVILKLAEDIAELAPGATLVNFTNPAGLITQALSMFAPQVPSVGVCNVPITAKMDMIERLEKKLEQKIDPTRCELNTLGLNHLSWHRGFKLDGEEMWGEVLQSYISESKTDPEAEYPVELIKTLKMIPNYYLQYFYATQRKLDAQKQWPPSRGEEVIALEKVLLEDYANPKLVDPPDDLMKRGGAYYSTVATQLLNAHYNNLGETHVVNVRQAGAINGWPPDWVLEMPCKIDHQGAHPLPAEPLPEVCFGLIAQVKTYEMLTARAAVTGDRNLLFQAMLAHPLGPAMDQIQAVMDDLLETHRQYLPQF